MKLIELKGALRKEFFATIRDKNTLLKSVRYVLLDSMLATGGTAEQAIKILLGKGIDESKITFVSVVFVPKRNQKA
jgi:uracil phosphoribosyltransferase